MGVLPVQSTGLLLLTAAGSMLYKLCAIQASPWCTHLTLLPMSEPCPPDAASAPTKKLLACALVSMFDLQAGVAMGLARIAGTAFTDWGPAFQTVMMAIIMINMLLGPPLFRTALIQVRTLTRQLTW